MFMIKSRIKIKSYSVLESIFFDNYSQILNNYRRQVILKELYHLISDEFSLNQPDSLLLLVGRGK